MLAHTWLSRSGIFPLVMERLCGDRKYEETPFASEVAVIVITNAMKSKEMKWFRDVTRGTSRNADHVRTGRMLGATDEIVVVDAMRLKPRCINS